jgi:hypothetical protein
MLEAELQEVNGYLQEARHNITLNLYVGRIVDLLMS